MNYKKSLENQTTFKQSADEPIKLTSVLEPLPEEQPYDFLRFIGFSIVAGIIFVLGAMFAKGCVRDPMPAVIKSECVGCHTKQGMMAYYFRKKNVKSPEQMAEAVLKTRNPRLLAAINVGGEKKTPHTAINTGWKGKYSGAWQTHERWGRINKNSTITEQALAGELAIETHTAEQKDIIRGLNAYGGESDLVNGKYAYNVLKELREVPK